MYQEIAEQPSALQACTAYNTESIVRLAAAIRSADPAGVYLAARGTSDHAGVYFKYLCETVLGLPVAFAAPSVLSLYGGKLDLRRQLVVGVSQSGKAADVLEVIRRGNECGAVTVAVTNDEASPLAKEAKFHLFCNAGQERSVAATKTFTTEALLLGWIVQSLSGDVALRDGLLAAPLAAAGALQPKVLDEVAAVAAKLVGAADCYVLGRGMLYGAVLEASLKLQETTYIRAKSYAVSDFHHGPFAVVDEGTRVILIAPDDESLRDAKEMLAKLKSVGADVTVITDADISGDTTVRFEKSPQKYTAFFAVMPIIQLVACMTSAARGLTPDAPRGLNKVTITK
jgi:glucosamine--fructose-6-phosphate aminotransferase (isomerizing)